MKTYRVVYFLILSFWSQYGLSQEVEYYPRLTLKYSPAALVNNASPAIQFGLEYRFHPRRAWHNEIGYVTNILGDSRYLHKLRGIRFLTEYRYYLGRTKDAFYNNYYIGLNFQYVNWGSERSGTFQRDNGAYRQRLYYQLEQQRVAFNFSIGVEHEISKRITMGFGIVMGRGLKFEKSTGIPEDAVFIKPDFFAFEPLEEGELRGYPDFLMRIQIGYILK